MSTTPPAASGQSPPGPDSPLALAGELQRTASSGGLAEAVLEIEREPAGHIPLIYGRSGPVAPPTVGGSSLRGGGATAAAAAVTPPAPSLRRGVFARVRDLQYTVGRQASISDGQAIPEADADEKFRSLLRSISTTVDPEVQSLISEDFDSEDEEEQELHERLDRGAASPAAGSDSLSRSHTPVPGAVHLLAEGDASVTSSVHASGQSGEDNIVFSDGDWHVLERSLNVDEDDFQLISLSSASAGNVGETQSSRAAEAAEAPDQAINAPPVQLASSCIVSGDFEVVPRLDKRPANILILTIGSRGDIQPFIALSKELQRRGHRVRLCGFERFRSFVTEYGIEFFPLAGDPDDLMKLCVSNGMFSLSFMYEGLLNFRSFFRDLLHSCWEACMAPRADGSVYAPDMVIGNPPVMAPFHIAQALDIPCCVAFTMPWSRTRAFPQPMVADRGWGSGAYNRWTFKLLEKMTFLGLMDVVNNWRVQDLKLPPLTLKDGAHCLHLQRVPHIYCYSQDLLPRPKDWGSWLTVTNFWFLDQASANDWTPPADLDAFISSAGERKLVYVGFGSIPTADPERLTKLIVEAGKRAGVKLVVSAGWGGVGATAEPTEDVIFIGSCPHDWLFPRMSAVVHHGGAGTVAAGLRAGCPTAVVAFFGDQFFWGPIIEKAGVGFYTHNENLTADWLANTLVKLADPAIGERARAMAEKINAVDGVGMAVETIAKYLPHQLAAQRVQEVVFENQRWYLGLQWTNTTARMLGDRPHFSNEQGL